MRGFLAVLKKLLIESRGMLSLSCVALFALSWFSVYRTAWTFRRLADNSGRGAMRARGFLQMIGGPDMDFSAAAVQSLQLYWLSLLVPILLAIIWGISRGASSVAGELERGSMDLILSRPMSRTAFFLAQVTAMFVGLALFAAAIIVGSLVGAQFNRLDEPARLWSVVRPTLNLVAVGIAVYGYAVFFSSLDSVRWRPTLYATAVTLVQFVALAVANQPDWDEWKRLNKLTIFAAYYPIEAAVKGEMLARNVGILALVFAVGTILGYMVFQRRDLPAGGG